MKVVLWLLKVTTGSMRKRRLSSISTSLKIGDFLVGTIIGKRGDKYIINVGNTHHVYLSPMRLIFPKHLLPTGSLVYGKVISTASKSGIEISCKLFEEKMVTSGISGSTYQIPEILMHRLLSPVYDILFNERYFKNVQFELIVGENGVLWINGKVPLHKIFLQL